MSEKTPSRGSAPTRRLQPWRGRLVARRARVQWQLVFVVTAIAVLACTLISSLALLVAATEQQAVRSALDSSAATETEVRVAVTRPDVSLPAARDAMQEAIETALGDAATVDTQALALSELYFVKSEGLSDLLYLGEVEAIAENATLSQGRWPEKAGEVALPDAGEFVFGVGLGDTIDLIATVGQEDPTVTVTGFYSSNDADSTFWSGDVLDGTGHDPLFPVPGSAGAVLTDAVGPLIVAEGSFDAQQIPVERLVLRVLPSFDETTVEQTTELQGRLNDVRATAPKQIGDVGDSVKVFTRLDKLVASVSDLMAVTRSTVVVLCLLLFVLALAALGQAARLLTEARVAERHLMRARGASARQVLGLAALETAFIAGVTVVASPMLARGIYLLISQQPAMVSAGMAIDPGVPPLVWAVAGTVSALFWLLLVAPLLGREASFHEGEQGKARQRRFSGVQRSGIDVAVLVLAIVAFVQLRTYQGPSSENSLGVDPVLVAGPAMVMLAGAFLAVRLVPLAAIVTDRMAERSTGAVLSLAAWEIGRRAQRATAAILLITIALAAGSFSLSFLSTWRQSQVDQSAFAVGAPLRLTSEQTAQAVPEAAQPVIRMDAYLAGPNERPFSNGKPNGVPTTALGLTTGARELLDVGRVGIEGGSTIAESIDPPREIVGPIELPDNTLGIAATVRVTPEVYLNDISVRIRALVEDEAGHQSLIDLGAVSVDSFEHDVRGELPTGVAENDLRLVGIQALVYADDPLLVESTTTTTKAEIVIRDLTAVGTPGENDPVGTYPGTAIDIPEKTYWSVAGTGDGSINAPALFSLDGWQLGLAVTLPRSLDTGPATYSAVTWAAEESPVVLTDFMANSIKAVVGDRLILVVNGVPLDVYVTAITKRVPAGGSESVIGGLGTIGDDAARTVVIDEVQLARALFYAGSDPVVREWWMQLDPDDIDGFYPYLEVQYPGLVPQSAVLLAQQMQEDPLRVATQAALWLVIGGAGALAAVGFAVHATGSLRSRVTEFAQLRAVGLSRRRLVGVIGIESALLCGLGTLFGLVLGVVLAYLVGPLVGVSGDGSVPVPSVSVQIPAAQIALLAIELAVVLAVVVLIAARVQRVAEPASALRQGDER